MDIEKLGGRKNKLKINVRVTKSYTHGENTRIKKIVPRVILLSLIEENDNFNSLAYGNLNPEFLVIQEI